MEKLEDNPYLSDEYTSVWLKHYHENKEAERFKFMDGVSFVKHKKFPLYINTGMNLTNGISYALNDGKENDFKGKVFLLYDIADYFKINPTITNRSLSLKKVKQYNGYLIKLDSYGSLDDYYRMNFSTKSRSQLKRKKRKLEDAFEISYRMHRNNDLTKDEFSNLFMSFNKLLKDRYDEKEVNNHYLTPAKWEYFEEVSYNLYCNNKASVFVAYDKDKPISISMNFTNGEVYFLVLPAFDINYSKYSLGLVSNIAQVEWCIENKVGTYDFSKGEFDYKKRFGNLEYGFDYHIFYDSKSLKATFTALVVYNFFRVKQFLRENEFHTKYHEAIFSIRNLFKKRTKK